MNDLVVAEIVRNQRRLEGKRWLIVLMFLIIAAVSFLFDIATGPAMTDTLPVGEVVNVLLGKPEVDEMNRLIVMDLRLPIAVMALVVGAALGVGGAEIQTLLNNPMASPYTLGLAAAVGLGAIPSTSLTTCTPADWRRPWRRFTRCTATWPDPTFPAESSALRGGNRPSQNHHPHEAGWAGT